jgi:hypothetical protein
MFFSEVGYIFPHPIHREQPRLVSYVRASEELKAGAIALVDRCVDKAAALLAAGRSLSQTERGARKGNPV